MSAAVYIPTTDQNQKATSLAAIDNFISSLSTTGSGYRGRITVSVLFGHEATPALWNCSAPKSPGMPLYPINALRNLAVAATGGGAASTSRHQHSQHSRHSEYLLYLDVDFVPSAGLSGWVDRQSRSGSERGSLQQLTSSGGLVVVPAFEDTRIYMNTAAAAQPAPEKRSLRYLKEGVKRGTIHPFHVQRYPQGHGATDYER